MKYMCKEIPTVLLVENEIASKRTTMLRRREGYEAIGEKHDEFFLQPAYDM